MSLCGRRQRAATAVVLGLLPGQRRNGCRLAGAIGDKGVCDRQERAWAAL